MVSITERIYEKVFFNDEKQSNKSYKAFFCENVQILAWENFKKSCKL